MSLHRREFLALSALSIPGWLGADVPAPPTATREQTNTVLVETSLGNFKVELFADKAPLTVKNFLGYVDHRFYDGTIFHRVIPNFMIQGGGMEAGLKEKKAKDPIKNEASNGLSNVRGTLAVARTVNPDSGTCQFFINLKDNRFLDRAQAADKAGYCVFGRVIQGMEVVDKITDVKTGNQGVHANVPLQDIIIRSIRRAG